MSACYIDATVALDVRVDRAQIGEMRFEKAESFVEIVLEGARVHVARGSRALTDADVRTYVFDGDERAARESFEERVAEIERSGYASAGEDSPTITSYVAKRDADQAQKDAQKLLTRMRGRPREEIAAEARDILDRWNAALARLDDMTASSLGSVNVDRVAQLEELVRR
jgi:hypothetical protein